MQSQLDELKDRARELSAEDLAAFRSWLGTKAQHPLEMLWGVPSQIILDAIARSSDLTKRGVRGVIAEAVFEERIAQAVPGWHLDPIGSAHTAYDFLFSDGQTQARVQVKLQRTEGGQPKLAPREHPPGTYVVEVQRTRGGTNKKTGDPTRPYRFDEFDILAVCLHPSSGRWNDFRFTLARWLIPRGSDERLIQIMQPVPPLPDKHWTSDLEHCLEWHRRSRLSKRPRGRGEPGGGQKQGA